ncbi:helicase-associated domain-containing protein [Canibacter zhoujuaniae]|uniref:helicase-associated domain-containing protein n=1 Tax=Canibacter zhoujuaniae TaxID=2708343 RepID=UPI001423D816|nr:helicase-associated domain-containing protein [Canibacter zhoujuaniae]
MPDILHLAEHLSALSLEHLLSLIALRKPRRADTFVRLAAQLLQPNSLNACSAFLTRAELAALAHPAVAHTAPAAWLETLHTLGLAYKERGGSTRIPDPVKSWARTVHATANTAEEPSLDIAALEHAAQRWRAMLIPDRDTQNFAIYNSPTDRTNWWTHAATAVAQVTQLCVHLIRNPISLDDTTRVVTKSLTRAAQTLALSEHQTLMLLNLALDCNLLTDSTGFSSAGAQLREWLTADTAASWRILAAAGYSSADPQLLAEIAVTQTDALTAVSRLLAQLSPQSPKRAQQLKSDATLLQLLAVPAVSSINELNQAATELSALLPSPGQQVIIQPDLSAIAPQPLSPETEILLLELADIEQSGVATVYRFTEASIARGVLNDSRTTQEWLSLLAELSITDVPSSLTFLIKDIRDSDRVVRLTPHQSGRLTLLHTKSVNTAKLMHEDRALQALSLTPGSSETTLTSPLAPLNISAVLQDAHYFVAQRPFSEMLAAAAQLQPRHRRTNTPPAKDFTKTAAHLKESSADRISICLEYAIHTGANLRLLLTSNTGQIEVVAVAKTLSADRVRLYDAVQQVERTVPVSAICEAEILSRPE